MTQELVTTDHSNGQVGVEALILKGIESNLPVESLERLLAMRNQLKAEAAREAYVADMAAFQAECPVIRKTAKADRYSYAKLEDIVAQTAPLRSKYGFSYRFNTRQEGDREVVECVVSHRAGHSESAEFVMVIGGSNIKGLTAMQESGAAHSYAKRYSYCDAFGIVTADEDKNGRETRQKAAAEPVEPAREPMTLAQQIAMVCREILVDRADLIRALTGKASGRDLTREEAQAVLDTARAIQRGEKRLVEVADVWQLVDVVDNDASPDDDPDPDADSFFASLQERP